MELAITGLGMVTSVGQGVIGSCAAIRAGITRPAELDMAVLDPEAEEDVEVPVVGHPMQDFSEGFAIVGSWLRLALPCLEDLASYAELPSSEDARFWERTALLVVIPSSLLDRFGEGADDLDRLRETYVEPLVGFFGRFPSAASITLVEGGHSGAIMALERARALIASAAADRVVVLAADSYLDDLTLHWLAEQHRLKTNDNPAGLAPGEGAASILLESRRSAERRTARIEAFVRGAAVERNRTKRARGEFSQGEALATVIRKCLTTAGQPLPFGGDLVVDLTGEAWRAHELGMATVRAAPVLGPTRWIHPASSIGDTGAAAGTVSLCVAVRSLVRRYARTRHVLVVASSPDGWVGAASVIGAE